MRNNSLAMLGTIAAVGILAWWIGFFDPTTCTPGNQQAGWTSCEAIAQERTIALWLLVGVVVLSVLVWIFRRRK
jgi:di/tricarboxylate transporter